MPLFDGVSLAGWKASEHPASFSVRDGMIVAHGERAHLFYVGRGPDAPVFTNFELKADVMTRPRANSGIFVHTAYQDAGWPAQGIEVQVNNSYPADPKRTGSLYNLVNCDQSPVPDDVWWEMHIVVQGNRIAVAINGDPVSEFVQPPDRTEQPRLSSGTIALQAHDPESEVYYRNLRLRVLAGPAQAAEAARPAAAPEPSPAPPAAEDLLDQLEALDFGGSRAALSALEDRIARMEPAALPALEARLLGLLRSPRATLAARDAACRLLVRIGSDAAVPALSALLGDPALTHPARAVLERLDSQAARRALREALPDLTGPARTGVVLSLGRMRDPESVPALLELAGAPDEETALAAVRALGQVGGKEACQALAAFRKTAPPDRRPAVTAAFLQALERTDAPEDRDTVLAAYKELYGQRGEPLVRIAALEGLVRLEGERAAPRILEALEDPEPELQGVAAQYVRTLKGQDLTAAFAARLPQAGAGVQVTLLAALGERLDPAAKPAVLAALNHPEQAVREAAAAALEKLGSAADIEALAKAAARARGPEREALCTHLSRLPGEDLGPALLAALGHPEPGVRAAVVRAVAIRRDAGAGPRLLEAAGDPDAAVRREALAALPDLVDVTAFPRLLGLLVRAPSPADREAVGDALAGIGNRSAATDRGTGVLAGALVTAMAPPVRVTLLRCLGRLGGETALWAVEDCLFDTDAAVVDAAVRGLCDWPDQAALDRLLRLAAEAPVETHRVLSLRAAVRLLGLPGGLSPDERLNRYERALELATRPDDRKTVLAGLGTLADPRAGVLLLPEMRNEAVRNEAAMALLGVARRILGVDLEQAGAFAARARETPDEAVRREAEAVLQLANEMRQYLTCWQYHGPHGGVKREELFATRFPPEEGADKPDEWRPMPVGVNPDKPWLLDLKHTPGGDDRAAYLRTYVYSAAEQKARLELGSDDGVKAWLNGRLVHANPAWRGVTPGQDKVPVTLMPGWNTLLLKVVNGGGDWGACARIVARDGAGLEGLRSKASLTDEEAQHLVSNPPPELVLHWPLDVAAEGNTPDAAAGTGPGKVAGEPAVEPGIVGNCFVFDGADDEVWLKDAQGLPTAAAEAWSVNVFVWIDKPIPELTILAGFGDVFTAAPRGCQRYLTKMREGVHFWGSSVDVNAGVPFDVGRWQMVTVTFDGREIALYKDGKRVFSHPETLADAAPVAALAPIDHWKKVNRFAGKLDEFTVWRGALSPEQVEALAAPLRAGQ